MMRDEMRTPRDDGARNAPWSPTVSAMMAPRDMHEALEAAVSGAARRTLRAAAGGGLRRFPSWHELERDARVRVLLATDAARARRVRRSHHAMLKMLRRFGPDVYLGAGDDEEDDETRVLASFERLSTGAFDRAFRSKRIAYEAAWSMYCAPRNRAEREAVAGMLRCAAGGRSASCAAAAA